MNSSDDFYNDTFYQSQVTGSYRSARVYSQLLAKMFTPRSVVDVGCGRGTWLKAFKEIGATKLVGLDGEWNTQENMIDRSIVFNQCDLNNSISVGGKDKFELAISLEVAEHLAPSSAETFVESLVGLSDVILFSAAFTGQGGTNHINEQPHTYWARLFAAHDYVPFDFFRPVVWGDTRVEPWYRKNAFIYVLSDSPIYRSLKERKVTPLKNIAFMDCMDSAHFLAQLSFLQKARLIPRMLAAFARRVLSQASFKLNTGGPTT